MFIVTGGAGFIGSNLVKRLNTLGIEDILIVDNLTPEKEKNLAALNYSDYMDKKEFIRSLPKFKGKNIDTIFHEGACSDTMETNERYIQENNVEYSKSLFHFAVDSKIRFVYASSASVYGNGDDGFSVGKSAENPLNFYANSKYAFDRYVTPLLPKITSQVVGLRYFNVFGMQENHKGRMASVVYHFHHQIRESGSFRLFEGSENFKRDFIFVEDVCSVNSFFLDNANFSGLYNCGTGVSHSFLDIADIIKTLYDSATCEFIPFPKKLEGKYQSFTEADIAPLIDLGYKVPFTSLESGVTQYVESLKNKQGYL
jgi:ADP-L-glycero-D-manno-heptose 6-epimerase